MSGAVAQHWPQLFTERFEYRLRNLRDLGGFRVQAGRIRRGLLYRSGHLDDLQAEDLRQLQPLALGLAFDLRHESEKAPRSRRVETSLPGLSAEGLSLSDSFSAGTDVRELLAGLTNANLAREWMASQYVNVLMQRRNQVLKVLERLMGETRPAIFFCVAGKDRTGLISALLLDTLGVPRRLILQDYRRTNQYVLGLPFWRRNGQAARHQYNLEGVPNAVVSTLADAHERFLEAVLDALQREGGIRRYLCAESGLAPELVDAFRQRMIEPA